MIFTKEPANKVFVFVTAYRGYESLEVNEKMLKGLKVHKASFSYMKWGFLPRFTVRLPNGRFKANKVGVFYVATH